MNAATIASVITVLGLVFLSLLALCAEKGEHPFRRARRGFRRLPAWEKTLLSLFVGAWIAFASVKEGTNGVNQVEGDTNTVTQIEGSTNDWTNIEGTNGTGTTTGLLTLGFFGRPNPAPGSTPSITDEDIVRMWRISSATAAGHLAAPTANAVTNAAWCDYGGMSDARRIKPDGWSFPYGDKATAGLTVFQNGDFRPNVKTHFFPRPFDANLSLLPRSNWGLLPDGGESVFWHEHTSSNSLILSWNNALYNREVSYPTNFQAELFADGRFDYRYPDRTVRYVPVFPFDWDGDGLENSVDPDPFVANPIDAHGANDEWLLIVCSNVFESVGGTVSFRGDVNTDAYYYVDVCAERGPAPVYFVSDRDSRLGSPVVVANGGETNRVPLLIGVEYVVTSTVPISVAFNDIGFAQVKQNDERSYVVKWPLAFHFAEGTHGQYTVSAVPYDPGVTYDWASTSDSDEPGGRIPLMSSPLPSECRCWSGNGATVQFICSDNCGCGGDCHATGTASMENASFAVTGGVCHCSLPNDHPSESPPSMPDPLVGGLSISFSRNAVIFEDEYRNTEDGPLVPRRSTTTRFTISVSGGFYGGSFALTLQNLDKLVSVGGSGSISLPTSKTLAPYETYYATFECEGVEASGHEDDVVVEGTFIEAVTWRIETPSAEATVVRVELEPEDKPPKNPVLNRHIYGLREKVFCRSCPSDVNVKWTSYDDMMSIDDSVGYFRCPWTNGEYTVFAVLGNMSMDMPIQVYAPSVECRSAMWRSEIIGQPGIAGMVGMILALYLQPSTVSFANFWMEEIPEYVAIPQSGYFAAVSGLLPATHDVSAGAGVWRQPIMTSVGNYWCDDFAQMPHTCPPMPGTDPSAWSDGTVRWMIPVGWGNGNTLVDRMRPNPTDQVYHMSEDGTLSISKYLHTIMRSVDDRVWLDGSRVNAWWNGLFH